MWKVHLKALILNRWWIFIITKFLATDRAANFDHLVVRIWWERWSNSGYSHHRAGVAALLATFPDEKRSVWLPKQQLLRLCPIQVANEPTLLVIVRQGLVILTHKVASVCSYTTRDNEWEQVGQMDGNSIKHVFNQVWQQKEKLTHQCSHSWFRANH